MDGISELARMFGKAVSEKQRTAKATVTRIDPDGTAYASIPGGAGEFPCSRSSVEVSPGDTVTVRIENGRAVIEGSVSAPSISAARASEMLMPIAEVASSASLAASSAMASAKSAETSAAAAADLVETIEQIEEDAGESLQTILETAVEANETLAEMQQAAEDADTTLTAIYQDAEDAKDAASSATSSANSALGQLGIVQDVLGTLDYAVKNGTMALTQDQAIVSGKVYFTYDSTTHDYAPVVSPQASALSTYYELTYSSDSMAEFVMAHIAVTSRGLWVLPSGKGSSTTPASGETQADSDCRQASDYKMLLASDSSYVYDGTGAMVAKYGTTVQVGKSSGSHIEIDSSSVNVYDESSNNVAQFGNVAVIGSTDGQHVTISPSKLEIAQSNGFKMLEVSPSGEYVSLTNVYRKVADINKTKTIIQSGSSWGSSTYYIYDGINSGYSQDDVDSFVLSYTIYTQNLINGEWQTVGVPKSYKNTLQFPASGESSIGIFNLSRIGYLYFGWASSSSGHYPLVYVELDGYNYQSIVRVILEFTLVELGKYSDIDVEGATLNFGLVYANTANFASALGCGVAAPYPSQTALGKWNTSNQAYAFTIGNGTANNARSNALAVRWNGLVDVAGAPTLPTFYYTTANLPADGNAPVTPCRVIDISTGAEYLYT